MSRAIERIVVVHGTAGIELETILRASGLSPIHTSPAATVWGPAALPVPHSESAAPADEVPAGLRLLTIPQVAVTLGIRRSSVYQLIDRGDLPTVRIGRSVRVTAADVDGFVCRLGAIDDRR